MGNNIIINRMKSDKALLVELGAFVQNSRLQQNLAQEEVAKAAGISRRTLSVLENGQGASILVLIQVLRALDRLDVWEAFAFEPLINPLVMAKLERSKRQRASKKQNIPTEPSSW